MKTKFFTLIAILIVAGLGMAWYFNLHDGTEVNASKQDPRLTAAMNECDSITEKAAQNLVAVVEFQKLEIIGRKARVFKACMSDHGYSENPAWTQYASAVADKNAKLQQISSDEAFENLRRADMVLLTTPDERPIFWVQTKK